MKMAAGKRSLQYTRYVTLALCIFQGYLLAVSIQNPSSESFFAGDQAVTRRDWGRWLRSGLAFQIVRRITLSAGTMFLMWVGDQITDRGIGNGMSLIITVGIVASLARRLVQVWNTFVPTRRRSEPSESDGTGLDDRVSGPGGGIGNCADPGTAEGQRAIR